MEAITTKRFAGGMHIKSKNFIFIHESYSKKLFGYAQLERNKGPVDWNKNIWKMLFSIGILEKNLLNQIHKSGNIWNENFANSLYSELSKNLYI